MTKAKSEQNTFVEGQREKEEKKLKNSLKKME